MTIESATPDVLLYIDLLGVPWAPPAVKWLNAYCVGVVGLSVPCG